MDSTEAVRRVLKGDKVSEVLAKEKKAIKNDRSKERGSKRSDSKEREGKSRKQPPKEEGSLKSKSHQNLKDEAEQRPTHRVSEDCKYLAFNIKCFISQIR